MNADEFLRLQAEAEAAPNHQCDLAAALVDSRDLTDPGHPEYEREGDGVFPPTGTGCRIPHGTAVDD